MYEPSATSSHPVRGSLDGAGAGDHDEPFVGFRAYQLSTRELARLRSTPLSRTSVVDELTARLASRRSSAAQRSAAYRRLALAIVHAAPSERAIIPVETKTRQPLFAAA